jgi:hypothetical protein
VSLSRVVVVVVVHPTVRVCSELLMRRAGLKGAIGPPKWRHARPDSPTAALATNALAMASDNRRPTSGTIIHSDQGLQYGRGHSRDTHIKKQLVALPRYTMYRGVILYVSITQ